MVLENNIAIWVITPNGIQLARKIMAAIPGVDLHISEKLKAPGESGIGFQSLSGELAHKFHDYAGHIFVMSTGIVVRLIAAHIRSKIADPAVVVIDDRGKHAISLLSGHLGGANELTHNVAKAIAARPVITTATDVNQKPAIDMLAKERHLLIDNPQAIKTVNMALLTGQKVWVHDPFGLLAKDLPNSVPWPCENRNNGPTPIDGSRAAACIPGVFIDDIQADLPPEILILRPATLVAGIGCNRNTAMDEMKQLLEETLKKFRLCGRCLKSLASIDLKADETGLLSLAELLNLSIHFFTRDELNQVSKIQNPSAIVEKHIGVKSVCEAAAIIAAQDGNLIVPKQSTHNVTVAIARLDSMSSVSAPAVRTT